MHYQGVEPFKISLRFRLKKFNFQRVSSGSGSRLFKNLGSGSGSVAPKLEGSVQVHRFEILKVLVRFRFNDSSVRVHQKKRFLPVLGSGAVRLDGL